MALLYGMICSWVVVLRRLAARKHNRLKKQYKSDENLFQVLEQDCKNEEVASGRPANLVSQMRLMKQFEAREISKSRWVSAERKLNKRTRMEEKVKGLQGRKIPYSLGLLDMAMILKVVDFVREADRLNLNQLTSYVQSFWS